LITAIDADDDVLAQHLDATELKAGVRPATSFAAIIQTLQDAGGVIRGPAEIALL
jgi:predicted methyltransferase MtxX (methanogen marker protein 4)